MVSNQVKRIVWIVFLAELAAVNIAVGITHNAFLTLLVGINIAFFTAVEIVLDHEARGRKE